MRTSASLLAITLALFCLVTQASPLASPDADLTRARMILQSLAERTNQAMGTGRMSYRTGVEIDSALKHAFDLADLAHAALQAHALAAARQLLALVHARTAAIERMVSGQCTPTGFLTAARERAARSCQGCGLHRGQEHAR